MRWNVRRFRPSDMMDELDMEDEELAPLTRRSQSKDSETGLLNNNRKEISQQSSTVNRPTEAEKETTDIRSKSGCLKRKNESNNDAYEHQTRSQTRRMKKN